MPKLHQIVALEKSIKVRAEKSLTDAYHIVQKPDLFNGLVRTYAPTEDGGERKPAESKKIQFSVAQMIEQARTAMSEALDITATKEAANCRAKASVVVGGQVLLSEVPVPTLLTIEKKLTDLRTFVSKLPVLDSSESWVLDPTQGVYVTEPVQNASTRKVQEPITLAAATDRHPAQVQLVSKDVLAGYWTQRKLSSAIPVPEQKKLLDRIDGLLKSVKMAREEANASSVDDVQVADRLFNYVFG